MCVPRRDKAPGDWACDILALKPFVDGSLRPCTLLCGGIQRRAELCTDISADGELTLMPMVWTDMYSWCLDRVYGRYADDVQSNEHCDGVC